MYQGIKRCQGRRGPTDEKEAVRIEIGGRSQVTGSCYDIGATHACPPQQRTKAPLSPLPCGSRATSARGRAHSQNGLLHRALEYSCPLIDLSPEEAVHRVFRGRPVPPGPAASPQTLNFPTTDFCTSLPKRGPRPKKPLDFHRDHHEDSQSDLLRGSASDLLPNHRRQLVC